MLAGSLVFAGSLSAAPCVGLVPAGSSPFWKRVEAGARQAGSDSGIEVYVRGTHREGQVEAQLQLIDKIVERGCQSLVIAPAGTQVAGKVSELLAKGIPSYYIDRDLAGEVQALIATDNYQAGQLAARHLGQELGGQGRVAIIRMSPPVASTSRRYQGFVDAAEVAGLRILFDRPLGERPEAVFAALHEHLPQLDAVFTSNGPTTRLTYAALKRMDVSEQPLLVGFDSSQILLEALKAGDIGALVVQQPYAMGYQSVRMAIEAMGGGRPSSGVRQRVVLGAKVVTRDNLGQAEIKALLALPQPY